MIKYILVPLIFVFAYSFSFAQTQYRNIMITNENSPDEPTVVINPENTNHIVAACNIDAYFFSFDGGYTWSSRKLESKFGVWGDPCLAFDTKDDLFYFHLSLANGFSNDRIVCQKSENGGITWTAVDTAIGQNPPHMQDKEWACIDVTNSLYRNNVYLAWTQCGQGNGVYDKEGGTRNPETSEPQTDIFFSLSTDEGISWNQPKIISTEPGSPCTDVPNTLLGVTSTVGPDGQLYECWSSGKGIIFNRSTDGGATWLEKAITIDSLPAGFKYSIPGIYRCFGFPSISCDRTSGPEQGKIYVSWTDQRNGAEDTDVWFTYSSDNGITWSKVTRVNNDPVNTQQFCSAMTIDQSNGHLYFLYYNRQDKSSNLTDVFVASSTDGGLTFSNEKISESSFDPEESTFFGDYISIAAVDGIVRPVWTRLDGTTSSLWTAIINEN